MKRIILSVAAILATASSLVAADYRGYIETSLGYSATTMVGGSTIGFSTSHGAIFNKQIYFGAGFDIVNLISPVQQYNTSSLFVDGRYHFSKKTTTPTVGLRVGPSWNNIYNDGAYLLFNPSIGYTYNMSRTFGADITLGYDLRFVPPGSYDNLAPSTFIPEPHPAINGFKLSLGIHF